MITIEESKEDGGVKFEGLPEDLAQYLFNYSDEELLQDPVTVLRSIIRM